MASVCSAIGQLMTFKAFVNISKTEKLHASLKQAYTTLKRTVDQLSLCFAKYAPYHTPKLFLKHIYMLRYVPFSYDDLF